MSDLDGVLHWTCPTIPTQNHGNKWATWPNTNLASDLPNTATANKNLSLAMGNPLETSTGMGKSSINGWFSIAMFDYQRVTPSTHPLNSTQNVIFGILFFQVPGRICGLNWTSPGNEMGPDMICRCGSEQLANFDDPSLQLSKPTKSYNNLLGKQIRNSGDLRRCHGYPGNCHTKATTSDEYHWYWLICPPKKCGCTLQK